MKFLFAGNAFNALCSMIISWVAAVHFSVEGYAAVAYAIIFANAAATVLDWGIPLAAVKLFNASQDHLILHSAVRIRLSIAMVTALAAILLPEATFVTLGFKPSDIVLGRASLALSSLIGLCFLGKTVYQARHQWREMAALTSFFGVTRLIGLAVSVTLDFEPLSFLFMTIGLPALISSLPIAWLFGCKIWKWTPLRFSNNSKAVLRYARWVGLGNMAYRCQSILVVWYTARFLAVLEVSKLSLAASFAGGAGLIVATLRSILIAKAAAIKTYCDREAYMASAWKQVRILSLAAGGSIAIGAIVLGYAFESKLPGIAAVFAVASSAILIPGAIGYFSVLIHTANRPQDEAALNIFRLLAILAALFVFRPSTALNALVLQASLSIAFEVLQALRANSYTKTQFIRDS